MTLRAELHIARIALRLIAGERCSHFTTGPGACWEQENRSPDAPYTADRWCDACIALAALGGLEFIAAAEKRG